MFLCQRLACSTNSPHSSAPRCGRICRARRDPGALMSALQRCAPRRRARRTSVGEAAGGGVRGARRAGGGVNEAMGESRAESLVGYLGEVVVGVTGESGIAAGKSGAAGRGVGAPWPLAKVGS